MNELLRCVRAGFALVIVVTGIVLLTGCGNGSPAHDYLYWADGAGVIGRADLSGSGVDQSFISTGDTFPYTVTVSSGYLYWANSVSGTIGRAAIDGTGVTERFITGASKPVGVVVSSRYIYWSNNAAGTIGRANLDGTEVDQRFITT